MNWLIFSRICTSAVLIPLIWGTVNYKSIKKANLIYYILIASLITEASNFILIKFFHSNLYRFVLIYSVFEVTLLGLFFLQSMQNKFKWYVLGITFLLDCYFLFAYFFKYGGLDLPYAFASIFEIILSSIYILSNTKNILNNWRFTMFFAFFQYNILAIGVFSMMDYTEKNVELVVYYRIIHSIANALMYILFTYGFIQCKKHFLKASL